MEKLNPRAVIFDLGSTLIEYESTPWTQLSAHAASSVRKFLSGQGFDLPGEDEFFQTFEKIKDEFRKPAAENLTEWTIPQAVGRLLDELGIVPTDGLSEKLFEAYYKPVGEQVFLYDDVVDTFDRLKAKALVIGLVSNTIFPEQAHRHELKRFKVDHYLSFAVFSSTFGLRKPHPDIFYKAANLAGYAPAECVYVGDRFVEDYQGPGAIGMPAVLKILPSRDYPADMPNNIRIISRLAELDQYLNI
jgi:FMN phosphatase YigB (HAD superfamily)